MKNIKEIDHEILNLKKQIDRLESIKVLILMDKIINSGDLSKFTTFKMNHPSNSKGYLVYELRTKNSTRLLNRRFKVNVGGLNRLDNMDKDYFNKMVLLKIKWLWSKWLNTYFKDYLTE